MGLVIILAVTIKISNLQLKPMGLFKSHFRDKLSVLLLIILGRAIATFDETSENERLLAGLPDK